MTIFTPYIEAPTIRNPVTETAGMNISNFENVLQGSEITNNFKKYSGLLAVGQSTLGSNVLEPSVYAQDKDYDDSTPFNDRYPILIGDVTNLDDIVTYFEEDNFSLHGVMEPFPIREIIRRSLVYISAVDITEWGSVWGSLWGGDFETSDLLTINSIKRLNGVRGYLDGNVRQDDYSTNMIKQVIEVSSSLDLFEPYEDNSDYLVDITTVAVTIPDIVKPDKRKIRFFNDTYDKTRNIPRSNTLLFSATVSLFNISGSIDDDINELSTKSSTAGFFFYDNSYGTDSIAFGGFLR